MLAEMNVKTAKRVKGAPANERGMCPACGRKLLGNIYTARPIGAAPFVYRQCGARGCGYIDVLDGAEPQPLPVRRTNFPKNKVERAVFEHYLSGAERGDLFRYVKLGKAGLAGPDRSHAAAYAAWKAGRKLGGLD